MRKVIGILLAVMMVFSLAACGETESTTESAETTKSVTVTPEHSESAEPSESPEPTESSEVPSEEPTEPSGESSEEATETAETVEPTEEEVTPQKETIEPVSGETVLEMANLLSFWMANSNFGTGRVDLDFDMACEVSAITASYGGETSYGGTTEDGAYYINIVPEENINQQLHNLFGSNYQAANYTRQEFDSAFTKVVPDYASVPTKCMIRTDAGQFALYNYSEWMDSFEDGDPQVLNVSLENDDSETCVGTVRYTLSYMGNYSGYEDVTFWLKPDEGSSFHWVITSIQSSGFVAG